MTKFSSFADMCSLLNEYHKDPHYIIAFTIFGSLHLVKYGNKAPETPEEMNELVRLARIEAKAVRATMEK